MQSSNLIGAHLRDLDVNSQAMIYQNYSTPQIHFGLTANENSSNITS
jgi:hypothetical protein